MAMTKPLPTLYKRRKDISWETFNFLLESVSFEDKIGNLYIVDREFDVKVQQKESLLTTKCIHQLLKNKKQLILVKDQFFNCLNNLLTETEAQNLIEQLLKHMQIFFKKILYQCILKI